MLCCLPWQDFDASWVRDGYILGLAGTRDVARHGEACWGTRHRLTGRSENPCKQAIGVAQAGSTRTPSFAREGVGERATHAEGELLGAEWSTPLPRKASINPTRKAAERKRLRYDRMTEAPSERSDRNSPSRWRVRPLSPVTGAASDA